MTRVSTRALTNHIHRMKPKSSGFSVVEAVIMALLLSIGATASLTLFTFAVQQQQKASSSQEVQEAISQDIASIERFNERIICTGSDGSCSLATTDPGESQYIPSSYDPNATINTFRDYCKNVGGISLGNIAATLLTTTSVPTPSRFGNLGITRNSPVASTTASGDTPSHRYTVTWSQNGNRMRQMSFIPRVAAWCP